MEVSERTDHRLGPSEANATLPNAPFCTHYVGNVIKHKCAHDDDFL